MTAPAGLEAYWPLFCRETATAATAALAALEAWQQSPLEPSVADGDAREAPLLQLQRELHSLKGMVATMGMVDLATLVHTMEDVVTAATPEAATLDPVRDALEWLLDGADREAWPSDDARDHTRAMRRAGTVAPAVSTNPHTPERRRRERRRDKAHWVDPAALARVEARLAAVDDARWGGDERRLRDAIDALMVQGDHVRLLQSRVLTDRLRAMIGPLADKLGKSLKLEVRSGGMRIDRPLAILLGDALGHLVRNAADHGIEPPSERAAAGKSPTGTIAVRIASRAGRLLVRVKDDGGGISVARVRRAIQQPHATLEACLRAVAAPGVTTAATLSDVSGRGVGLDAVVAAVVAVGGRVHVGTAPGAGTAVVLELPMAGRRVRVLPVSGILADLPEAPWLSGHRACVLASSVTAIQRDGASPIWHLQLRGGAPLRAAQLGAIRWAYRTGRVASIAVPLGERAATATALVRDRRSGEMLVLVDVEGGIQTGDERDRERWTWVEFAADGDGTLAPPHVARA